jgi:hypothetical protein
MSGNSVAGQATSTINPITSAPAFDIFRVRTPSGAQLYSPPCKIVECNGRETIAQEQQAPGMTGAILVTRGTHLVSVTYELPAYSAATFAAYDALIKILKAAQNARPQQSLVLTDLRLRDMRIPAVTPVVIPAQNLVASGSWSYKIKFTENARLKIAGGPVKPARNPIEAAILATEASNAQKRQLLGDNIPAVAKAAGKL